MTEKGLQTSFDEEYHSMFHVVQAAKNYGYSDIKFGHLNLLMEEERNISVTIIFFILDMIETAPIC